MKKSTFYAATIGLASMAISGFTFPAAPVKGDQEVLSRASEAFHTIAKNAMPAVVSIAAIKTEDPRTAALGLPPGTDLPPDIQQMLPPEGPSKHAPARRPGRPDGDSQQQMMMGIGSGVVIRKDGLILTNNHVVEDATRITVSFDEKHKSPARLIGADAKTDIAIVQLENPPANLQTISFGDSEQIQVGDWAIAIGSPFGLNHTVTSGIISAKGRGQMGMLDVED
ncbi:MAG: trypsin-like peptidase domain-containing protein, partial [Bdellovibrionota bacterium]